MLQVEEEDDEFVEEFLSAADPSILHFLLASGEQVRPPALCPAYMSAPARHPDRCGRMCHRWQGLCDLIN